MKRSLFLVHPPFAVWLLICLSLAWINIPNSAHAGPVQDAKSFGAAGMNRATGILKSGSINANTIPGFTTANPPQTAFQNNPGALSNAATTAATQDKTGAGKFIVHSAATRAQFNFTANDPLMKNALGIRQHAQALVGMNATSSNGSCRNVTTTTPDLFRTYTCATGKTSNVFSKHVCTTGKTPNFFSNHGCTSGRTSDVFGSYACTRGRTPDVFSNHACTVRIDPDIFSNHSCYTGRHPDIYKNYTCTKSRPSVISTCDRALVVTATSRPYCSPGQTLASSGLGNIAGPGTYGSPGYLMFTAQCGAPGGWTNVYIRGADWLGSCDYFKWYRGLGHLNVNIPPWRTGFTYAGAVYLIKWSGYFYCMNPAQVYYRSRGCSGNNCAATFRVDDGTTKQGCSNGAAIAQRWGWYKWGRTWRYGAHNYCPGVPTLVYGWYKSGHHWYYGYYNVSPHIMQVPNYKYHGLFWTRAHNIVTYSDQWVNQACR